MEHDEKPEKISPWGASVKELRFNIVDSEVGKIHGHNEAEGEFTMKEDSGNKPPNLQPQHPRTEVIVQVIRRNNIEDSEQPQ